MGSTLGNIKYVSHYDELQKFEAERIVQALGETLLKKYPGYRWFVDVNMKGGIAGITLPAISTEYGMQIHLDKHTFDLENAAINAGGELLERFGLNRTMNKEEEALNLAKDARGNAMAARAGGI